jgi:YHS domain-containing protein
MFRPIVMVLAVVAGLFASSAASAADPVFVEATTDGGRAAIRGYDPVAYHLIGAPVLGSAQFTHEWRGASWRFASAANRDAFAKDPERYAPQYGGYCAFGTSRGYKVSTQPDQFAVVGGKLYLNYNAGVMQAWDKDRPYYIGKADANWTTLAEEPYESDAAAAERIRRNKAEAEAEAKRAAASKP